MKKIHFHANLRETGSDVRSLGSYRSREDATTGLLLAIGQALTSSPGWVTREAYLPADGIGTVVIENLMDGGEVSSSVWGCECSTGTRDLQGTDDWRSTRAKVR
jgi:hypothetical protein